MMEALVLTNSYNIITNEISFDGVSWMKTFVETYSFSSSSVQGKLGLDKGDKQVSWQYFYDYCIFNYKISALLY